MPDIDGKADFCAQGAGSAKELGKISLQEMKAKIIDGDTFDVDFNGNGKFSNPEERILLLYEDTTELSKSLKGKEPRFGLPAKGCLSSVLSVKKAMLWVDSSNRIGVCFRITPWNMESSKFTQTIFAQYAQRRQNFLFEH